MEKDNPNNSEKYNKATEEFNGLCSERKEELLRESFLQDQKSKIDGAKVQQTINGNTEKGTFEENLKKFVESTPPQRVAAMLDKEIARLEAIPNRTEADENRLETSKNVKAEILADINKNINEETTNDNITDNWDYSSELDTRGVNENEWKALIDNDMKKAGLDPQKSVTEATNEMAHGVHIDVDSER
jgi:hypothetical protein